MSYTPGPWKVETPGKVRQVNSDEGPIALVVERRERGSSHYDNAETDANARLMCAAPDLLEALKELYAQVCGECPSLLNEDSGGDAKLDSEIRDAIARAEGK